VEERHVDVAIIGSGTAGLNAMGQVRRAGKTFVLINGGEPGTTCARVGCMPSKALIQVAEDYHRRTTLGRYGVDGHEELSAQPLRPAAAADARSIELVERDEPVLTSGMREHG
jgi:dihydrolipoamide dehydrogenase